MASHKPYECFKCRDNGFPNTMVYLAGKDEQGKTVYIEEDGTAHQHKQKQQQGQAQQPQPQPQSRSYADTNTNPMPLLRILDAKMDRVIALLEKQATTTATTTT